MVIKTQLSRHSPPTSRPWLLLISIACLTEDVLRESQAPAHAAPPSATHKHNRRCQNLGGLEFAGHLWLPLFYCCQTKNKARPRVQMGAAVGTDRRTTGTAFKSLHPSNVSVFQPSSVCSLFYTRILLPLTLPNNKNHPKRQAKKRVHFDFLWSVRNERTTNHARWRTKSDRPSRTIDRALPFLANSIHPPSQTRLPITTDRSSLVRLGAEKRQIRHKRLQEGREGRGVQVRPRPPRVQQRLLVFRPQPWVVRPEKMRQEFRDERSVVNLAGMGGGMVWFGMTRESGKRVHILLVYRWRRQGWQRTARGLPRSYGPGKRVSTLGLRRPGKASRGNTH